MPPFVLPPALAPRARHSERNPPLTPERLEQFERRLPHPLPVDFREALVQYNGVKLGPCSTGLLNMMGGDLRVDEVLGLNDRGLSELEYGGEDIPSDVLAFASPSGGVNRFGLQLADRPDSPRGTVWYFDAYAPSEAEDLYVASVYAESFTAFLARLSPLPEAPLRPMPVEEDPASPWSHPEALEKVPADVPTPEKPLVLAGHGHAIEGARLEVDVTTWLPDPEAGVYRYAPDRATARYALELDADARSGERGLPAPSAADIPVLAANGGRHPTLAEWPTLVIAAEGDWDAWCGNDAPSLFDNRLTGLGRTGAELKLRWEASYSQYGRDFAFVFEGPVRHAGIRFDVRDPADIDRVLASAFGGNHLPAEWMRHVGERQDRGENVPPDMRYAYPVTLVPAP
jgi:hypothetical protein